MGNILTTDYRTGVPYLGLQVWNDSGQWWRTDTAAFETYNVSNEANYGVNYTEHGSTGIYEVEFPADIPAGRYTARVVEQAAEDYAAGDSWQGSSIEEWDGSDFVTLATSLNTALPANPTANSAAHYLQIIDAVVGGITNTDTPNEVAFHNRSNMEVRRCTFGTADGSRTGSVIS